MANPTANGVYLFQVSPVVPTVGDFNTYNTVVTAVLQPEEVLALSSGTSGGAAGSQTISSGTTWTKCFLATDVDTNGSLHTDTVTISWGGIYNVSVLAQWAASQVGRRDLIVKATIGGSATYICASTLVPSVAGPTAYPDTMINAHPDCHNGTALVSLNPGDTIEVYVSQSSGASLDVAVELGLTWLSN